MDLNYSPWNDAASGMSGLANSMAGVVMAQQQNKMRQFQMMQQAAIENAYLRLAQEREQREATNTSANVDYLKARTGQEQYQTDEMKHASELAATVGRLRGYQHTPMLMNMVTDPTSGPQIINDLRGAGVVPQGGFDMTPDQLREIIGAALSSRTTEGGMGTPASAAMMSRPQEVSAGATLVDPFTMQKLFSAGPMPMNDYQRQALELRTREDEIRDKRFQDQLYRTGLMERRVEAMEKKARDPYGLNEEGDTGTESNDYLKQAKDAIAKGADRKAVAARYKKLTGQDLPQ